MLYLKVTPALGDEQYVTSKRVELAPPERVLLPTTVTPSNVGTNIGWRLDDV